MGRKAQAKFRPGDIANRAEDLRAHLTFNGHASRDDPLAIGVCRLQRWAGLSASGRLNWDTCALLNADRCSAPDRARPLDEDRALFATSKFPAPRLALDVESTVAPEMHVDVDVLGSQHDYELIHCRWSRRSISYSLVGASPAALGEAGWEATRSAFRTWSSSGLISIEEIPDARRAEIRVLWTAGPAADPSSSDPFYGPGGYVAVGYYPYPHYGELAGDLHLDLGEPWTTTRSLPALDLETVVLHEIGHVLGIGHSSQQNSVMWPRYKEMQRTLPDLDVEELARRYRGVPA